MAEFKWKDQIWEYPRRYKLQQNADGTVDIIPNKGTSIQDGTPANAENFNTMIDNLDNHIQTVASPTVSGHVKTSEIVLPSRKISTDGTGLLGGGDLSQDRTLSVNFGTSSNQVARGNHSHYGTYLDYEVGHGTYSISVGMKEVVNRTISVGSYNFLWLNWKQFSLILNRVNNVAMGVISGYSSSGSISDGYNPIPVEMYLSGTLEVKRLNYDSIDVTFTGARDANNVTFNLGWIKW